MQKQLLAPFGIQKFCTDGWKAYERHLPTEIHTENHEVGKRETQRTERKYLWSRTRIKRLARKTIYFFKSKLMHDLGIGLFINCYEFKVSI